MHSSRGQKSPHPHPTLPLNVGVYAHICNKSQAVMCVCVAALLEVVDQPCSQDSHTGYVVYHSVASPQNTRQLTLINRSLCNRLIPFAIHFLNIHMVTIQLRC